MCATEKCLRWGWGSTLSLYPDPAGLPLLGTLPLWGSGWHCPSAGGEVWMKAAPCAWQRRALQSLS